ncbi:MAG: hypothetical protein H6741_08895 [Alphaproteobacteria bacterium]|nr:hypothetical protein [Alphaproteobacteria bacterium]MCB9792831.1 hypothetical protein [Alphaproteobacteria bacterium]
MQSLSARIQALRAAGHPLDDALALTQQGVEAGHLPEDELDELIDFLSQGLDWLSDEVGFEFLGEQLRVSFLGDNVLVEPEAFLAALKCLRAQ